MVCDADSQLLVRQGLEEKAADVWTAASRSHLNLDFTFGSQALAVASTDIESIGVEGVAQCHLLRQALVMSAVSVWGNSALGLLS